MTSKRKRASPIPKGAVLDAVPCVNEAAELVRTPSGASMKVPLRRPRTLVPPLTWILRFSAHRRVEIDRVGGSVLDLCDGKRTVERIIEDFAARHKLTFHEARIPVVHFLRQLTERGIIAVVGPSARNPPG